MKGRLVLKNFRIVDESKDLVGAVVVEDGLIRELIPEDDELGGVLYEKEVERRGLVADRIIDGRYFVPGENRYILAKHRVLMPAFVDLHAHFRDPGFPEKETLESGCLAAATGGYGTVACMANTKPVIDTAERALALRQRARALGLIDLYPVLSLTMGMEGKQLSGISSLEVAEPKVPQNGLPAPGSAATLPGAAGVLLLSEDGKDVADDALFAAAFGEAKRLGIPVSCHCDNGGSENAATQRAIGIGRQAGARVHIAHVSTREAAAMVREAKSGAALTCEATPHHIALTRDDAEALGAESWGRVNPSLRSEEDRRAIIAAILDGTVDAIATDHAPHAEADKAAGAPGFTGLETAFPVCYTVLTLPGAIDLSRLSFLMSGNPARLLGFSDRGSITAGLRADLVIVDTDATGKVDPETFKSRGRNSPFAGRELRGRVLMTLRGGRTVYQAD
jgi:dihydroorotase